MINIRTNVQVKLTAVHNMTFFFSFLLCSSVYWKDLFLFFFQRWCMLYHLYIVFLWFPTHTNYNNPHWFWGCVFFIIEICTLHLAANESTAFNHSHNHPMIQSAATLQAYRLFTLWLFTVINNQPINPLHRPLSLNNGNQQACTRHAQLPANNRSSFDLNEGAVGARDVICKGSITKLKLLHSYQSKWT